MKRIIKSRIFTFILGAIIFGSVGVIAANYVANDISFTPKDTTWKKQDGTNIENVQDALNSLYENKNEKECLFDSFICTTCNTSDGQEILNFKPSSFIIYDISSNGFIHIYDSKLSTTNKYYLHTNLSSVISDELSKNYSMNNNLIVKNLNANYVNKTLYYYACK